MPPKKRAGKGKTADAKKQKTNGGKAKPKRPEAPVDEGFTDDKTAKVYVDEENTIWDASLNLSNVSGNNNKFYMLQVLQSNDGKKFYSHQRWGRVGEPGQNKTISADSADEAMDDFRKKFKSKTGGIEFEGRFDEEAKDGKYHFLEKSYEDNEDDDDNSDDGGDGDESKVKSELDKATQRLMELIFNENYFNSALEDLGYNQDKMPLGKLGKKTLSEGFDQLNELASLIKHPSLAKNKYNKDRDEVIEEWTNKYYSTIPHIFGRNRPPLIDNDNILRREVAMLDTLTDMEVANTIMKGGTVDDSAVNKLDAHFKQLKLKEMTVLDHKSDEYKELQKYLIDSSSSGHGMKFRLQDIFRIERPGEEQRFKKATGKFKDNNRLLLWHGSRTSNYGGILSQGLRIAPPEAPVSGYAFGKGIYLADVSSKSAGYCVSSLSGNTGLLLLVEAELSRPMYEISSGDSNAQQETEKKGCVACKGVGKTVPLKWKDAGCVNKDLKGIMMPDGQPGNNKNHKGGYLMYNEYISYHVEHLKLRYLFKVGM